MGDVVTPGEAERRLMEDLERHDITPYLDGCATSQCQFDAMTSLAFNIGLDRFNGSTVLKRHRQGNYSRAADAFPAVEIHRRKAIQGPAQSA
jgi:lysozyme